MIVNKYSGFTLIELLVVVSIIALLSTVTLSSVMRARYKAADSKGQQTLTNIRTQFEIIRSEFVGTYATFCSSSQIQQLYTSVGGTCLANGTGWAVYVPSAVTAGSGSCVDLTGNIVTRGPICGASCAGVCGPI